MSLFLDIFWKRNNIYELPTTRKTVIEEVNKWLQYNEWNIIHPLYMKKMNVICAKKNQALIVINCSGIDHRLQFTQIKDLQRLCINEGFNPIFILGEEKDSRLWNYVRQEQDVIISVDSISRLNLLIDRITPTMVGIIDCIESSGRLGGWVKLSPHGRAELEAHYNDEIVGRCTADIFRRDLLNMGDGRFAFALKLEKALTYEEIRSQVRVKGFYNSKFLGIIYYTKKLLGPS